MFEGDISPTPLPYRKVFGVIPPASFLGRYTKATRLTCGGPNKVLTVSNIPFMLQHLTPLFHMAKPAIFAKIHKVELRKDECTFDAKLLRIEKVLKYVTDPETGERTLQRDADGNAVYDDRRRRIVFRVEGQEGYNDAFVFTNVFTNGEVPTITDRKKGLDVTITAWTDDEDRVQYAAIDYNPGDSVVVASSLQQAIDAGKFSFAMK